MTAPRESVRVTVIGSESNVAGMPWSRPSVVSVRPVGKVPLETIHVYGVAPPVACSCWEYAKSLNAAGKEAVVIVKGDTTVIEEVRRTA